MLLVLRPEVRSKDDCDHTADAFRLLVLAAGLSLASAYAPDALAEMVEVAALMDYFRSVKGDVLVTHRDRKTPFGVGA